MQQYNNYEQILINRSPKSESPLLISNQIAPHPTKMYITTIKHRWNCWLPALMLLVLLAQLSTSSHSQFGEHSVVDCTLCYLQPGSDDEPAIATTSQGFPQTTSDWTATKRIAPAQLSDSATHGIRAPPAFS